MHRPAICVGSHDLSPEPLLAVICLLRDLVGYPLLQLLLPNLLLLLSKQAQRSWLPRYLTEFLHNEAYYFPFHYFSIKLSSYWWWNSFSCTQLSVALDYLFSSYPFYSWEMLIVTNAANNQIGHTTKIQVRHVEVNHCEDLLFEWIAGLSFRAHLLPVPPSESPCCTSSKPMIFIFASWDPEYLLRRKSSVSVIWRIQTPPPCFTRFGDLGVGKSKRALNILEKSHILFKFVMQERVGLALTICLLLYPSQPCGRRPWNTLSS